MIMMNGVYKADEGRYNGTMRYRRAGWSGILLSELSLGLWHNFGGVDLFENSKRMLHYAFDKGVTYFDLANNYGPPYGSAEETFGKVMKSSFMPYRSELFIATKAGHEMWPGPYGEWGSRKNLMNSLDASLRRMNLDYVDVFYSHRYDPDTPLEETLQALVDIVKQGKALYAGISKYPPEPARIAYDYLRQRDVPCLLYQGRYNLLDRAVERESILDQAKEAGAGFVAFSPLAQGLLSDRYLSGKVAEGSRMSKAHFLRPDVLTNEMLTRLNALAEVARDRGQTLAEMALAWLLKDDKVTSVIVGASSLEQLQMNLNALNNTSFSEEELARIDHLLAEPRC
jgi:L-glyceraldehyde 3-phosphate reductase